MTIDEARKKIEDAGGIWLTFQKWMIGQTCGVYPDGSANIYEFNVDRFIKYSCDPNNEPLYEQD